jgi:methionyl-tRNA formyltransferase
VVAFKMLPKIVWDMPRLGTFNLHASLLPQYRGAAPINWAIINGDNKTGVTTFFLKHKIDTGNVIFQEEIPINNNDNAGDIHDKLMYMGANVVVKTVDAILKDEFKQINQNDLISDGEEIKHAPKIFKADCKINWQKDLDSIYNLIRGLSPYPTAWTEFINVKNELIKIKIFITEKEVSTYNNTPGKIISDRKTFLKLAVQGGYINILELQQAGKKRMSVTDFLKGFQFKP